MNSRIFLVRHGETTWSKSGRHTSRTDVPLTGQGEKDARRLARRLRIVKFDRVLTSPALRARRTCALAGMGRTAAIEPDLAEWDYGDYEGRLSIDIHKERPRWNLFRDGCPGGESPRKVSDRADRLIARLRAAEGTVAVFTHGHFGRVLAARWIGLPVVQAQRFLLSPASLSMLGCEHDSPAKPVIALWNS